MRLSRVCFLLLLPLLLCGQAQNTEPEKAALEGLVLNTATGQPVRKVRLSLRALVRPAGPQETRSSQPPGTPPAYLAASDAAGRFEFTKVDPGNYELRGVREGFNLAELALKEGGRIRGPITLSPGEKKAGVLVRMTPLGVVTGRVADEDGDPIRGVQIAIMNYQYSQTGRELVQNRAATSDDMGEYRIYDVASGRFYLRAGQPSMRMGSRPEEAEGYVTSYYPVSSDVTGATQLEIGPGQQLREMNFTMRRTRMATIRGRIIAPEDATSMSIGFMIVQGGGTSMTNRSVADKEGRFELVGVSPGPIYLVGSYLAAGKRMEARVPLQVGSEDINGIELVAMPGVEVRGRVRIDGTNPVKFSQVTLRLQAPGQNFGGLVREDGSFEFKDVAASAYKLSSQPPPGLYLKAVYWGEREITDAPLDLTSGVPSGATLTVVYGADGGEVSGTVTDADSNPASPALVILVPTGSHRSRPFYRIAFANSTGRFTIRSIAPGEYKLFAWDRVDQNAVIYDPDFLRPYDTSGHSIRVLANEKQTADLKLIINKQGQ